MKLFIIHKGRQEYLLWCIKQLLKFNNPKDIIFLSDDSDATKKYVGEDDITYEDISDYSNSANEFAEYYQHRSYNKPQYELFCMQRWLILNEYVNANNINVVSHIDTDVMLYCDMEKYYLKNLSGIDFSCTGWSGGVFFGTKKGLNKFSSFLINCYKNKFNTLEPYFTGKEIPFVIRGDGYTYYDRTNCITDMTLFYVFLKKYIKNTDIKTKDIGIISNSQIFDSGITSPDGFEFTFGLKKIRWDGTLPYCYLSHKKSKGKIYFNALHFQGESKIFMKKYYDREFSLKYFFPQLKYQIKKGFIEFCETIFRFLGIHSFMRNIRLKIIRRGINPKNNS